MSLKFNYTINQVLSIKRDDLISSAALGSYCKINLNNYTDPQQFIDGITNYHVTADKLFTLTPSINNSQIYVNKNNFYLLFTSLTISNITQPLLSSPSTEYRWVIFENITGSTVEAMTDASGALTSDFLTSKIWFTGPNLTKGLYKIVYDVQSYPIYNKPWTRWRPPCVRCPGQGMFCNLQYTQEDLDMRRKAEVLQYRKNAMPISRKMNWRLAVKKAIKQKNKNTYSSQTVTYTNPNTKNLVRIDNKLIINPQGFGISIFFSEYVPLYAIGAYCNLVSDSELKLKLPSQYKINNQNNQHNQNKQNNQNNQNKQKFYFSYKNEFDVYITSIDSNINLQNIFNYTVGKDFKIGILFDSSGNTLATCSYNIRTQDYTTVPWTVQQGEIYYNIFLIEKGNCKNPCNAGPLPPTFSNVPGKGPYLYMDPTIPLTQYITRRTYKGTSENVSRLFSGKGVQGIWDNYSYEIRRGHGGHAGPGPSPPGPTPQVPPSTKNCNCTKEGVRDCWNRIGKTNNKYFKLQTVAECSVGGKCECSYIALTLKDTTSGPSKIILHPQIPLYWAGVLQDDSVEFMSEIDPCGKGTNPSTGGGNVNFFLGEGGGICYSPEGALLLISWVNGNGNDSNWKSHDIWTARDLFSKDGWSGQYEIYNSDTGGPPEKGTATAYFTSHTVS